jgi:hypothetical protein
MIHTARMLTILLVALGAVLVWIWLSRRADSMAPPGVPASGWRHLLQITAGDAVRAKAMIDGEKERSPGISDAEACVRVIRKYQRDNR